MPVLHRGVVLALGTAAIVATIVALGRTPQWAPTEVDIEAAQSAAPTPGLAAADAPAPVTSTAVARVSAAASVLTLSVDDAVTGQPIAGAQVRLLGMRRQELAQHCTDAEGELRIERPTGWGGRVLITSPGYRPRAWRDVEQESQLSLEPIDTIIVEVDGVPMHLLRHAEIRVRIDYHHLRAMPGSVETLSAYEWFRDSDLAQPVLVVDGRARLPRAFVQRAQIEVFAAHPASGWQHRLACSDVLPEQRLAQIRVNEPAVRESHFVFVRLNVPERVAALSLELDGIGPSKVKGRLQRSSLGEPFTGWAAGLLRGSYNLVAEMGSVKFDLGRVEVDGLAEVLRQFDRAELHVRVNGPASTSVSLAVIDAATGRTAMRWSEQSTPRVFRACGLRPGTYEVRATSSTHLALPAFADVALGETRSVDLEMLARAMLRVVLPRGAAGATLRIVDLDAALPLDLPECRAPIGQGVTETSVPLPFGVYGVELTVDGRLLRRDVRVDKLQVTVDFR